MSREILSPAPCLHFDPEVKITTPAAARHNQISSLYSSKLCLPVSTRTIKWTDGVKHRLLLQTLHDSSSAYGQLEHVMFRDCEWPYWTGRGPFECGVLRPSLGELKEIMKRLSGQPSTGLDSKLVPPVYESTVPNIAFLVRSNGQWRKKGNHKYSYNQIFTLSVLANGKLLTISVLLSDNYLQLIIVPGNYLLILR